MSDDRIAKATLAAGIFQAVFPTVTTDRGHDIAVDETVKLTELIYSKLFPLFGETPGGNSGTSLRDFDPDE